MKTIPLTQGKVALVDDDDYERLMQYKWCAHKIGNTFYATRSVRKTGTKDLIFMHREIMGCIKDDGVFIDHRNRNGLHNWRENLRKISQSINIHNCKKFSTNTSGYRGVVWEKRREKWQAQIVKNRKNIFCGYFPTPVEAAIARDEAALKYYGPDAILNFPKEEVCKQ